MRLGDAFMWVDRFKRFILNNKFVLTLMIMLLIGLNVLIFTRISFIFKPLIIIVKTVSLPIILAGIAYYLLNPVVDYMERRNVQRVYTILTLYLIIIGLISLFIFTIIPLVRDQISSFSTDFPKYIKEIEKLVNTFMASPLLAQIQQMVQFDQLIQLDLNSLLSTASSYVGTFLDNAVSNVGAAVGAVTEVVLGIVIAPFALFYLLKDGKKLPNYYAQFLPVRMRQNTHVILGEMNHQISSYIRGQIIVSFCIGLLLFVGYNVIQLDYSLALAVIAALTSIVPYIGPTIAITPALIIAMVTSPFMLVKMIIVWTIVQLIEGKFISPQVMGKNLDVHPLTIIFVILIGGNLFGFFGILLAVPGYALLKVICTHLFSWIKNQSSLYREN